LQGVEVEASRRSGREWTRTCATDAEGRFALAVPTEPFDLSVAMRGRCRLRGNWEYAKAAGSDEDLGDLKMTAAFAVRGQVVDDHGAAVEMATVMVFAPMVAVGLLMTSGFTGARSRADGSFELDCDLPPGKYQAGATTDGATGDCDFAVDAVRGCAPLRIVVAAPAKSSIEGVVVDDVGQFVAEAVLQGQGGRWTCQTDGNGRFRAEAIGVHDGSEVVVDVMHSARCDIAPPQTFHWGDRACRIVLPRAQQLGVEVVDDAGEPVTHFGVWLGAELPRMDEQITRARGEHESGRAMVAPARRGRNLLRVIPDALDLMVSEWQEVLVGDAEPPPARVVLERMRTCPVDVVDVDGKPVAEATLLLVHPRDEASRYNEPKQPRTDVLVPRNRSPELVAKAVTGLDGTTRLLAPKATDRMLLRVEHARLAPVVIEAPAIAPDAPLHIVLTAAGSIVGHVDCRGEPDARFRVDVMAPGRQMMKSDVRVDGHFTFDHLPTGTLQLQLVRVASLNERGSLNTAYVTVMECSVEVRAGVKTELTLAAPPRANGRLRGRLRLQGLELRDARIVAGFAGRGAIRGEFAVAPDGSFVADALLPGRWRFTLRAKSLSPHEFADELEVTSDCDLEHEFVLVHRRLVLKLRRADGAMVEGCELRVGSQTMRLNGPELVLDPAPVLPLQVRVAGPGHDNDNEWSAPYALQAGGDDVTAEISVPAPK
jgi:hypothetical protein